MLEGGYYTEKLNILKELCRLNSDLKNIFFLPHMINIQSLDNLSKLFHFDVVLAFLVIHQIAESDISYTQTYLEKAIKIFHKILSCGNDVIIETSLDVFPEFDRYISQYCKEKGGKYLGEVQREKQTELLTAGRLCQG